MNCYGLMNIFNDIEKKKNKKVLILGFNGLMLNFLETIMYYSSRLKKYKLSFFSIKNMSKDSINL